MNMCFNCFKTADYGHWVSHAKNRVAHTRKPNLHRANIVIDGVKRSVLLCTKCVRVARLAKRTEKKSAK